ncbi:MAG: winged helix-turn-helix transcriptional regulator [Ktedonobacterales bacterium]|nr:winged helix-turn-helix transcriptional regulator [Ktedonobacterales bacterium]
MSGTSRGYDPDMILPEEVPVEMPELPRKLLITTDEQFKALADPVRTRILRIIQNAPATAKQIADRLGSKPGTIGHHLQVLEAAGLAWVVARRQVRGTVAKYYTRTARLFDYSMPRDATGSMSIVLGLLTEARDEMLEAFVSIGEDAECASGFPHVRLSPERARVYRERLDTIVEDLLNEPSVVGDQVYGLCFTLFVAPAYVQPSPPKSATPETRAPSERAEGERAEGERAEGERADDALPPGDAGQPE